MSKRNNSEKYAESFTREEVMVVAGSRELKDGDIALVGVGLPQASAILAKYTHAPKLKILLEIGIADPKPVHPAIGLGDPRIWYNAAYMGSWLDIMGASLHRGIVDVGFLSGIQVDQYGNINSTMVGSLEKPVRHFTGSGGANDIASLAKRFIIIMRHEKRRFPKRVDYVTSPGYVDGVEGRKRVSLRPGGPVKVLTDLAVLGFDEKSKKMKLISIHPGVSVKSVVENTGFELIIADKVPTTPPPTIEEQKIMRTVIDPDGKLLWKKH